MTALQVRTGHGVVVKRMENGPVNVSFLSKKMGGKIVEWYVYARPIVD